tara:strand:- start:462 stop:1001 length:540 start_codon:yes stop_codon:yes gene_type:complete
MTQRNDNIIQRTITKRNFNVVLDIYNTAAWTGRQFNPVFQVDLKRLVQNPEDLAKPYKITFSYYMMGGLFSTSTISTLVLYALHIDLRRQNSIQNYNKPLTYAGNLQPQPIINAAAPTIGGLIARPQDNHEFYVDNLTNLSEIELVTIINSTGGVFNAADTSAVNAVTKYIVYLHFEEL